MHPWWGRGNEKRMASGAFAQAMSHEQQRVQTCSKGCAGRRCWHVVEGHQPARQVTRLGGALTAELVMLFDTAAG